MRLTTEECYHTIRACVKALIDNYLGKKKVHWRVTTLSAREKVCGLKKNWDWKIEEV